MAFQDALEMMFPLVRRKDLPRIAATVAAVGTMLGGLPVNHIYRAY